MCRNIAGRYPGGEYVCLYEGEGSVSLSGDARELKSRPGRIECRVDPSAEGIILRVTETTPGDPVRKIRFVPVASQGEVDERPFRPAFLRRWSPLGILRFTDWQCTTSSAEHTWAGRTTPGHQSQARAQGVALEHMIQLANASGADPWFSMPHNADDHYVRQFATMVRDRLSAASSGQHRRPDRAGSKVYVEYSAEVWNFALPQAAYAMRRGREQGLGPSDAEALYKFYSRRSVQVFRIWEEVFGSTDRLVRVLGVQCANSWMAGIVLDFEDAHTSADAVGVAPYFGEGLARAGNVERTSAMTLDEVLDACDTAIDRVMADVGKIAGLATERDLGLVAYGGGSHLVPPGGSEANGRLAELFAAARRHPRMGKLYQRYLEAWRDAGGGAFVVSGSMGSRGILESEGSDPRTSPKYEALSRFMADHGSGTP